MVEILAYAFGIMYSPGPVNLVSLNSGLQRQTQHGLAFCIGVGVVHMSMFALFGYTGSWLVSPQWLLPISLLGSAYILYLAYKIARAGWAAKIDTANSSLNLNFRSGALMQLLNPKAPVAILPIVTIQFPAAGVGGYEILLWSCVLGIMAAGAPGSYLLMGSRLGRMIQQPRYYRCLNLALALLLAIVAIRILLAIPE